MITVGQTGSHRMGMDLGSFSSQEIFPFA